MAKVIYGPRAEVKRLVIKIGSSSLNHPNGGICHVSLAMFVAEIARLREQGIQVIIVSSGAVAAGMGILGLRNRPKTVSEKQATAAVGQGYLIQRYNEELSRYGLIGAQVLLTRADLGLRERYCNARNTLESLLRNEVVPIVNENDTVAVEELCFGDNDKLSALVAGIVDAQLLAIFSDIDGLYTANPRQNPEAELITRVMKVTPEIEGLAAGKGSEIGTGGMLSKLSAAKMVTNFGIGMLILNGGKPEELSKFLFGGQVGTYFEPRKGRLPSRKRWMGWGGISEGTIQVDEGAKSAIINEGKSLLPKGVVKIEGNWEKGNLVRIVDAKHEEIARGVVSLSSVELERCKGLHSEEAAVVVGREKACEVIHRDFLTVVK
ncbi:MAG TPA: glutamate 5-kinase [Verrucomicrobiae bacterium]|nr:glutamate 5-kinase [Verrucomicrobiae bacterium]